MAHNRFTLAEGLTAQTSLTGHRDGPYADVVLAHNGSAWHGTFTMVVAALVHDVTVEGDYGPVRVDLPDGQGQITGVMGEADETGFSVSGRRIQYDDVEAIAL